MVKWLQFWNLLLSCEAPILLQSVPICTQRWNDFCCPHKICEKLRPKGSQSFFPSGAAWIFVQILRFGNPDLNLYLLLLGGRFKVSTMIQDGKDTPFDKSTKVVWQWWRSEIKIWADRTVKHCSQLFNFIFYCWVWRRVEERGVPESYKYKTTKENHQRFPILSPSNGWSILAFTAALGDSRNAAVCRFMSFHPNINIKKCHWNAIRKMWSRFHFLRFICYPERPPHTKTSKNPPKRSAPAERRHFGYRWSMSRWAPASCPRRTPPRRHQPAGRHGVIPFIALGVIS